MLPFQNASGMFQDQMRSRLGFGPSNPSPASPLTPHNTGPVGPGPIMDRQGKLGGVGTGAMTGGMPNGGVVGPRSSPVGSPAAGDATGHAPGMGLPPVNRGPIGPNGPGGPYGGGSSTGPVESSMGNNAGSVLGGWNLGGAFNPTAPQAPQPFMSLSSLNNPMQGGNFDYGASANTALMGRMDNPYGPNGVSQDTSQYAKGYLNPGVGVPGSMAYSPQGGIYGGFGYGANPQMMPDRFANMNYNLPVYGNIAAYPGSGG